MTRQMRLALVITAINRAAAPLRQVARAVRRVARQTGLDRVARAAGRVGAQLRDVGMAAVQFARTTGLAAIAAGAATVGLAGRFASAGDNVAKTADRLGLGVVGLQRWRYAAERSGVEAQTFDMAVQRFGRRAAEAAAGTGEAKDALAWLGIQLRDTTGKMRPTEDLMLDVADALEKIEDPLLRNRVAFKLFDSEGVDVGRMLAQGRTKLKEYGDEAERLGVITEEQARAAEQYTDDMTALRRAISFLGHGIGATLLPVLTPAVHGLRDFAVAARPEAVRLARAAINDFSAAVRWLRTSLAAAIAAGHRLQLWIRSVSPPVADLIERVRAGAAEFGLLRIAAIAVAVALGARLIRAVLGLFGPLARLAAALVVAGGRMTWMAAVAIAKLAGALGGALVIGLKAAAVAVRALTVAMRGNPIIAIATGIALAAAVIYRYWDDIAAWFGRQWAALKAAVPVGEWLAELRTWSLWDTLTGWWAGLAAWFGRQWAALKAAVPVGEWLAELRTWSLWDTLTGWWAGLAAWFGRQWAALKAAVPVGEWLAELRTWSLWDTLTGWWAGLAAEFARRWAEIEAAFDFDGLRARWQDFTAWLRSLAAGVRGLLPSWLTKAGSETTGGDDDRPDDDRPGRPPRLRIVSRTTDAADDDRPDDDRPGRPPRLRIEPLPIRGRRAPRPRPGPVRPPSARPGRRPRRLRRPAPGVPGPRRDRHPCREPPARHARRVAHRSRRDRPAGRGRLELRDLTRHGLARGSPAGELPRRPLRRPGRRARHRPAPAPAPLSRQGRRVPRGPRPPRARVHRAGVPGRARLHAPARRPAPRLRGPRRRRPGPSVAGPPHRQLPRRPPPRELARGRHVPSRARLRRGRRQRLAGRRPRPRGRPDGRRRHGPDGAPRRLHPGVGPVTVPSWVATAATDDVRAAAAAIGSPAGDALAADASSLAYDAPALAAALEAAIAAVGSEAHLADLAQGALGDPSPAPADTASRRRQQAKRAALAAYVRSLAAVRLAEIAGAGPWSDRVAATAARDRLTAVLGPRLDAAPAATYVPLQALATAAVERIDAAAAALPPVVEAVPGAVLPSLVLAWRWYGGIGRAGENRRPRPRRPPRLRPGGPDRDRRPVTARLAVAGARWEGWTEVRVTRSLEALCSTFSLALSERWPGQDTPRPIRTGDAAVVTLDGDTVVAGHVDEVDVQSTPDAHALAVSGRDATADLVDCSAHTEPGEWHGETLDRIATAIAAPYGVTVRADADVGKPFAKFRIEEGEAAWEAIERACRMRAVLGVSDGAGTLVLTSPPAGRAAVALERGVNILSAQVTIDRRDRYGTYVVLGQQPGTDFLGAAETAHVRATATDPGVRPERLLILLAEQSADIDAAQVRADWEASGRAARSRRVSIRTPGWRQGPDGPLWRPNLLTTVRDGTLGLDGDLLTVSVRHVLSEETGTVTDLDLAPPDAWRPTLEPEPPADAGSGWWG